MSSDVTTASQLDELFAPLSRAEFLSLLRQRELTLLRGSNGQKFVNDIGWDALKAMIARGQYPRGHDDIRVSKESVMLPEADWSKSGKVDAGKLDVHLARGFNIVITHLEPLVPRLGEICTEIQSWLHESSFTGVIVTMGTDGAFKRHYDPEDLIIVQVEGSKRWQIFNPSVVHPVKGMPKIPPPQTDPVFDEVLHAGDVLLLPGGNWHHCENEAGRSVHLGIFLLPTAAWHAVNALTAQLLADELFRTPISRVQGEPELAVLEAELKQRLAEKVAKLKLSDYLRDRIKKTQN